MLTEAEVRFAKPREKAYKLYDERGLFLLVTPTGSRWWRFKYYILGKERGMSLGVYPDVTLKDARERRDQLRRTVAQKVDPALQRQAEKIAQANTLRAVAEEWFRLQEKKLCAGTLQKARRMMDASIYPRLGPRPIAEIKAPELLGVLRLIEDRGTNETAHRAKQRVSQILRYAIATGRAERDITLDLRGALAPVVSRNHPAIVEPTRIGALLRAIDGYDGQAVTAAALKFAPLVFVRPGELRGAEWPEFDLEAAEWRIPAARMKMKERHVIPLSRQAVQVLRDLKCVARVSRYVFPSLASPDRRISENTINAALRRLGYSSDEMTGHGFRAMASTCLNELGWSPDLIELQLAHAERNRVRAAYNRAERLKEPQKMMQAWADYLDTLRGIPTASKLANGDPR
jgi:integrase